MVSVDLTGLVVACRRYEAVAAAKVSRKSFLESFRQFEIFLTGFKGERAVGMITRGAWECRMYLWKQANT